MDRTPIGRFVLILVGVGLACVIGAGLVYLEIQVHTLDSRRVELKKDVDNPITAKINAEYAELTAKDNAHKSRKAVIDTLKAPFRWSDVLDILCDKVETTHKKIWFDNIRVLTSQEARSKQQQIQQQGGDLQIECGLIVEAQSAGIDPEPYLAFRRDVVQKAGEKVAANTGSSPTPGETAAPGTPPAEKAGAVASPPASAPPADVATEGRLAARRSGKVLIDYFTGGILRIVQFSLKDQKDFEEQFSNSFVIEFYVRKGATPAK